MGNENTIGEMIRDNSGMMDFFKSIPNDKRMTIIQMAAPWGCWDMARVAYESAANSSPEMSEDTRLLKTGTYAEGCLQAFRRCMGLLGKGRDETLRTMDDTSRWLKRNGWNGLPEPTNRIGMTIRKTAADMYADMERFAAARREYLARTELQNGERR